MGLPCRPRVNYRGYAMAARRLCYPHVTSAAVVYGGRQGTGATGRTGIGPASLGPGRLSVYYSAGRNYSRVRKYQGRERMLGGSVPASH